MTFLSGLVPVLCVLVVLLLGNIFSVIVLWRVALLFGLRPRRVQLFSAPVLIRRRVGPTEWVLGSTPVGSHVWLPGMSPFEDTAENTDGRQFWQLSRWAQVTVVLSYPMSLVAVAVLLIGSKAAFSGLVSGLWQLPMGAIHPFSLGSHLVAEWQVVVLRGDFQLAFGLLFAKFAALELLPIGSANSLRALWSLSGWVRQRWVASIQALALLAGLLVLLVWGVTLLGVAFAGANAGLS